MGLIDHLSLGVDDIANACQFYDSVLESLGAKRLATLEGLAAYGSDRVELLLMLPANGEAHSHGNGTHTALFADSRLSVDQFHELAVLGGGICEGQPGVRDAYPKPDVYAAYVRDPFGNKLEVVYNGFAV